jgi:hypothetical protein
MTGDAAHRVGVFIIDLADQPSLALWTETGGREHLAYRFEAPSAVLRDIDEVGGAKLERAKDSVAAEAVECGPAYLFDDFA